MKKNLAKRKEGGGYVHKRSACAQSQSRMKHKLEHEDSPTWCIYCGRFDYNCGPEECDGEEKYGQLDSRTPEVYGRMFQDIFGSDPEYHGPVIEIDLDKGTTTVMPSRANERNP
jgi:hypothetical protein